MIHELKIAPDWFKSILSGKKSFEVRKADRPFQVGDLLALNEYDKDGYTHRSCMVHIDYILDAEDYCKAGMVIMSIKPCFVSKRDSPRDFCSGKLDYRVPLAPMDAKGVSYD